MDSFKEQLEHCGEKLERCPVCGRYPKIKVYGVNYAKVECKPFLRKSHMFVFTKYEWPSQLMAAAVKAWNEKATCARLPVW